MVLLSTNPTSSITQCSNSSIKPVAKWFVYFFLCCVVSRVCFLPLWHQWIWEVRPHYTSTARTSPANQRRWFSSAYTVLRYQTSSALTCDLLIIVVSWLFHERERYTWVEAVLCVCVCVEQLTNDTTSERHSAGDSFVVKHPGSITWYLARVSC